MKSTMERRSGQIPSQSASHKNWCCDPSLSTINIQIRSSFIDIQFRTLILMFFSPWPLQCYSDLFQALYSLRALHWEYGHTYTSFLDKVFKFYKVQILTTRGVPQASIKQVICDKVTRFYCCLQIQYNLYHIVCNLLKSMCFDIDCCSFFSV